VGYLRWATHAADRPSRSATGKANAGGRDLLSLLVCENLSENAAHRLSDDDVLARAPRPVPARARVC
jgi:hypothetical protein